MTDSTLGRLRARRSQSWAVFGRDVSLDEELARALTHSARSRLTSSLVRANLRRRLRQPVSPALPPSLQAIVGRIPGPPTEAVTWLVHNRPSGRTVVHEIAADSRLVSVVKIGAFDDQKLKREHTVLAAFADRPAREFDLVVPVLLGVSRTDVTCAVRSRLDIVGLARSPYRWSEPLLDTLGRAIGALRERLTTATLAVGSDMTMDPRLAGQSSSRDIDLVPAHGDLTAWNLFVVGKERVTLGVIDFEECGLWPRWWDPARFVVTALQEGRLDRARLPSAAQRLGLLKADLIEYVGLQSVLASDADASGLHSRALLEAIQSVDGPAMRGWSP